MNSTLESLIALQRLDKTIFEMQQRIANIPKTLQQFDELLADSDGKVAKIRASIEEQERTRRGKELEIEANSEQIKKYQGQLLQVKTNKEYSALLAEINGLKSKNTLIEDDIIELMESIERAKHGLTQSQEEVAQTKRRIDGEKQHVLAEQQTWQQELATEQQARDASVQGIEPAVLREYARLLQMRNGIAVAAVTENGTCSGCYVALTPQMFAEVKTKDTLHRCPVCLRFLYAENV